MAGMDELVGGMLNGFVGSKNKAQEMGAMNEYRKAMTDHVKTQAKLEEQKINLAAMKAQGLPQNIIDALNIAGGAGGGGGAPIPANQPNVPAVAQVQPSLPDTIARAQMPISLGGGVNPAAANSLSGMEKEFGEPIKVTDSFRTTAQQADLYARKPNLAAPPGHSLHEKGLAFDIDPAQANRLAQSGLLDRYGFNRPMLGQGASGKNEPWHIEYTGAPQTAQPQPQPQAPGPIFPQKTGMQAIPMGTRTALDVWFKSNYDLDTKFREDRGKYQLKGDPFQGFQVFNSEKGNIEYVLPPVQTKLEPYTYSDPSGTGAKYFGYRPSQIITPNRGGFPATPQAAFGGQGGPGGQIEPPEYTYEKRDIPGGAKQLIPVPKAQAGAAPINIEPPGVKIADAGRVNMIMQANNRMDEVNQMVLGNGNVNRNLLAKAIVPYGGIGEGSQLQSKMYQTVESALRLETGAQANADEIKTKMKEYWPSVKDTDATIRQKMKDLNEYVKGVVELHDPTGQLRKMRGKGIDQFQNQRPQTASDYLKKLQGGNQ